MCVDDNFQTAMDELTQKFGYMDVKQSSRVRGRKLRTWRRRWVVFTKMSNLSSDEIVGKMDLYESDEKWKSDPTNKVTFILEHVTAVRQSDSRTHPHAFEIVEKQPNIVLSGTTELESYSWLLSLQQIFTPDMVESNKDSYTVTILPNEESTKWKLEGEYCLTVSENGVTLIEKVQSKSNIKISWGLSTLIRFNMEKEPKTEEMRILSIKCGPNSPTGESTFRFISDEVKEIIKTIRHYICIALAHKQNVRRSSTNIRARSISATYSEKNFMNLLDAQPVFQDQTKERSGSDSSGSTLPSSVPVTGTISSTPDSTVQGDSFLWPLTLKSNSELEVLDEVDEHSPVGRSIRNDTTGNDSGCGSEGPSVGTPDQLVPAASGVKNTNTDPGYSVIKDVSSKARHEQDSSEFSPDIKVVGTSGVEKISAQVSEELILPASFVGQCKRFQRIDPSESPERTISPLSCNKESSTSSLDGKGKKKVDPIYQEVDKFDREKRFDNLSTFAGALNRRRSSSTPDLQAFWKLHGFDTGFENVYEELDEHRRSFFPRPRRKEKEVPPALPARPFTINFSTVPKDNGKQPVVRLKNSFSGKSHSSKGRWSQEINKSKSCTCKSPRPNKSQNSKRRTCCECGRKIKLTDNTNDWLRKVEDPVDSTKEALAGSSRSYSSNDNVDFFSVGSDAESNGKSRLSKSLSSDRSELGRLVDIDDCTYTESLKKSPLHAIKVTQPCRKDDPLIGFFLDDEKFDTNPLVTGELVMKSNFDFLTSFEEGQGIENHDGILDRQLTSSQPGFPLSPMRARCNTNSPPAKSSFKHSLGHGFEDPWNLQSPETSLFPPMLSSSTKAIDSSFFCDSNKNSSLTTFPFTTVSSEMFPSSNNIVRENSYIAMTNRNVTSPSTNTVIDPFGTVGDSVQSPFDHSLMSGPTYPDGWATFDTSEDHTTTATRATADLRHNEAREATNDNDYVRPGWVTSH